MILAKVSLGRIAPLIRQAPQIARPVMRTLIRDSARALISSSGNVPGLVQVTPPSQGKADSNSKERGMMGITADLLGLNMGRGKHNRTAGVFVVMDDQLLARNAKIAPNGVNVRLFIKKDGTIYGCDRHLYRPNASTAEMYAHHQSMRRKSDGRVTRAGGATREIGRWKFITQMVVSRSAYLRYERFIHKRVGMLAAGLVLAYNGRFGPLKGVPAWIKRHSKAWSVGTFDEKTQKDGEIILIGLEAGTLNREAQRRFNYVLGYRLKAMQRQLPYLARVIENRIAAQLASA